MSRLLRVLFSRVILGVSPDSFDCDMKELDRPNDRAAELEAHSWCLDEEYISMKPQSQSNRKTRRGNINTKVRLRKLVISLLSVLFRLTRSSLGSCQGELPRILPISTTPILCFSAYNSSQLGPATLGD
jgi:hypothetical protein